MFLFLLGLLTGLVEQQFTNTRMGLAAIGRHGQPWQESLVTLGFATLGAAILLALILILYGLRRNAPT